MKCPRCNTNLGEDNIYCPQCGLSLMDWFMKGNFEFAQEEGEQQPAGDTNAQDFSEKEADFSQAEKSNGQTEEMLSDSQENTNQEMDDDSDNDSNNRPVQEPYSESCYKSYDSSPYQNPYGDYENGLYDDPYKNIKGKKKADSPSDIPEDLYENVMGQRSEEKEQDTYFEESEGFKEKQNLNDEKATESLKCEEAQEPVKTEEVIELKNPEKDKKIKVAIILLLLILSVGLGGGYLVEKKKLDRKQQIPSSETGQEIFQTPTAALTPEQTSTPTFTPEPTVTQEIEPALIWQGEASREAQESVMDEGTWLDKNHMTSLMEASGARYGLYVMDLVNCTYYAIGEAETPLPASALIGIPIMFTIAEGISDHTLSMDDSVLFTYTFANGRGNIKSAQNGMYFTLGDLLKEALLYSDNNALNSLIDYLTLDRINTICHQYGFNSVDMQRKLMTESSSLDNYISAKDAAMMINAIYQDNFTQIDSSFLKDYFKLVPGDTANKGMYPACGNCDLFLNLNGITESRYNEIGLVENGEEVFIMAAMTVDGKQENSVPCITNEASYVLANLEVGKR